jgi:hypothetical protein
MKLVTNIEPVSTDVKCSGNMNSDWPCNNLQRSLPSEWNERLQMPNLPPVAGELGHQILYTLKKRQKASRLITISYRIASKVKGDVKVTSHSMSQSIVWVCTVYLERSSHNKSHCMCLSASKIYRKMDLKLRLQKQNRERSCPFFLTNRFSLVSYSTYSGHIWELHLQVRKSFFAVHKLVRIYQ